MKKFIIITIVLIIASFFVYKKWQKESFGLKNPKLETESSIKDFIDSTKIIVDYVLLPKDFESYTNIKSDFDIPSIYVFDKDKVLIDSNITNDNGSCLADISKMICNNFETKNPNFKSNKSKILFDLLMKNTTELNKKSIDITGVDYIVVYSFGKFLNASFSEEALSFTKCKDKNTLIILLNLDFVESWYGQRKLPVYVK